MEKLDEDVEEHAGVAALQIKDEQYIEGAHRKSDSNIPGYGNAFNKEYGIA